jgi:hypothetical protein
MSSLEQTIIRMQAIESLFKIENRGQVNDEIPRDPVARNVQICICQNHA